MSYHFYIIFVYICIKKYGILKVKNRKNKMNKEKYVLFLRYEIREGYFNPADLETNPIIEWDCKNNNWDKTSLIEEVLS